MESNAATSVPRGRPRASPAASTWVTVYATGVAILGGIIILLALGNMPDDRLGLIAFAVTAGLVELSSVELFQNSRSRVSVSVIIAIASILVFGPLAGALTHMISGAMTLVTTSFLQKQLPQSGRASWLRRASFNIGMWVTATAIAGWVYTLTGGMPGQVARLANVLPLVAAVTADALVNQVLLIVIIGLQTGQHSWVIWRRDFKWGTPIAIVAGVFGGGALALAYEMFGILGLIVFCLPVLATGYSFRLYVSHTRQYVNRLEEMNRILDEANVGLLETLGAVIDAYDVYTYGHSAQVAVYAGAIAERMNLPAEQQAIIVKAALVHDVGKVGIRDSIIGKQGPLTDEEFQMMRRHPIIGAEIVGQMKGLHALVPLVRHHHERWDGRGYPDRLAGSAIPLGARIMAVADTLDAMCSDRPYRATRSLKEIVVEIERCAGSQFDPVVVEAFLAVVAEKPAEFFKNSAAIVDTSMLSSGVSYGAITARHLKKSMVLQAVHDAGK